MDDVRIFIMAEAQAFNCESMRPTTPDFLFLFGSKKKDKTMNFLKKLFHRHKWDVPVREQATLAREWNRPADGKTRTEMKVGYIVIEKCALCSVARAFFVEMERCTPIELLSLPDEILKKAGIQVVTPESTESLT